MEIPIISVIIPVYNAQAYLPACIASVRACSDDAVECILINDGSTDESQAICQAVIAEDKRFRLINKENSGVSESRNVGLRAAHGQYILFLDADDYINTPQWEQILHYAYGSETDLVAFGYYSLFPSGHETEERFPIKDNLSADPSDTRFVLLASPMLNTCWGKLLRRSVIEKHGLHFDTSLVTCEDAVFMIGFVDKAYTFLLCNQCILYYRIHETSAMRLRPLEDKLEDFSLLYARRAAFLDNHPDSALRNAMFRECFSVLTDMLLEYAVNHSKSDMKAACSLMLNHPVTLEILAGMDPNGITPFYKRLEYRWMRHGFILPLSVYFRVKSCFRKK